MKRILSLFVVLVFAVSCGGGSGDSATPENSPDFEEIEIPTEFEGPDGGGSEYWIEAISDAHLIPADMLELFKDALTVEVRRDELIKKIRESSLCGLDDKTDEELWDEIVYQFSLEELWDFSTNNLEEAIRNSLAHDLNLILDEEDEMEFYGDTLEAEEIWTILAAEVNGIDPGSDHEDISPFVLEGLELCSDYFRQ